MINIVDAIMGSGKTSAAIQYMNEHADRRFLYITPFNEETSRIRDACPSLDFWIPSNQISKYEFRKGKHLKALVEQGRNVAMTHTLFKMSENEVVELIAERGYVVIIDEVIDVFEPLEISGSDIEMIINSGWLVGQGSGENTEYEYLESAADKKYQGGRFTDLFTLARSRRLINLNESSTKRKFCFWTLHKELFTLSDTIFVLTYLFDGMPMKAFLDMNGIPYRYTGVGKDASGCYRFSDDAAAPEYVKTLPEKIHICSDARLNSIGDRRTALSASWTKEAAMRHSDERLDRLRRNINTFFRNHCPADIRSDGRLWCTYKDAAGRVRDKGFYNSHLAWNSRATNKYQHCAAMAYCVNVFMNPNMVNYFSACGTEVDVDQYALANMVQWIYRGAIRRGEEIWLYVPSARMRQLLKDWISSVSAQAA